MKRGLIALATVFAAACSHAADVGVSISVGQPGFYGQLDIGNFPRPQLIHPNPVVIEPPRGVTHAPLYLRVPPGHSRDWRKHCRHYNACGRPVYFVQDRWYNEVYAPRYRERHRERGERGDRRDGGHDRGRGREHGRGQDR